MSFQIQITTCTFLVLYATVSCQASLNILHRHVRENPRNVLDKTFTELSPASNSRSDVNEFMENVPDVFRSYFAVRQEGREFKVVFQPLLSSCMKALKWLEETCKSFLDTNAACYREYTTNYSFLFKWTRSKSVSQSSTAVEKKNVE